MSRLTIEGIISGEIRIPDAILYINGLPLVVFEFKSAIREEATIHDAYVQVTIRYRRDIPALFVFNAFCIISDGVNNMGSFFAPYEFFYNCRKITGNETIGQDGIDSLHTMIQGLFDQERLKDVIHHFIYMPDTGRSEEKIVCCYPQYYAATKLFDNIKQHQKPYGDGKDGTYFGATGCGKSFTMTESVRDEITVRIVYEGHAAKVMLDNSKLQEIEDYYQQCSDDGANDYQIDKSKKAMAQMRSILGDPKRLKALAADFVQHYEKRVDEGATINGKAMFVSSSRSIAHTLYQEIIALRPEWAEVKDCTDGETLTEQERKEIKPVERIKMVMTRGKFDNNSGSAWLSTN